MQKVNCLLVEAPLALSYKPWGFCSFVKSCNLSSCFHLWEVVLQHAVELEQTIWLDWKVKTYGTRV